jgi:hypothetical protein
MLAARWADDIRTEDRDQNRPLWHYIGLPFRPAREPANIQISPPQEQNIVTALIENERIARTDTDAIRKAIAVTWLFHLVGDVHQPLHSTQMFATLYPEGDQLGSKICIRDSTIAIPETFTVFGMLLPQRAQRFLNFAKRPLLYATNLHLRGTTWQNLRTVNLIRG